MSPCWVVSLRILLSADSCLPVQALDKVFERVGVQSGAAVTVAFRSDPAQR